MELDYNMGWDGTLENLWFESVIRTAILYGTCLRELWYLEEYTIESGIGNVLRSAMGILIGTGMKFPWIGTAMETEDEIGYESRDKPGL